MVGTLTIFVAGCATETPPGSLALSGEDVRAIHAGMMVRTADQCRAGEYTEPEPYYMVPPRYPKEAASQAKQGSVSLAVTVRANGLPDGVQVVASEPPGVFDSAAEKAVEQWRFKPKCVGGKFVDASAQYTVRFKLP